MVRKVVIGAIVAILVIILTLSIIKMGFLLKKTIPEKKTGNITLFIIEIPDKDAIPVIIKQVIDGDTVRIMFKNGVIEKVRLVGYNAWEIYKPEEKELGLKAKKLLEDYCKPNSIAYLDIDDEESRDKYGRLLGYLWCKKCWKDSLCSWILVQKLFLLLHPELIKNPLYIPPDEHPYHVWLKRFEIKFEEKVHVIIINSSGFYDIVTDRVILTGGIYKIMNGSRVEILNLLK